MLLSQLVLKTYDPKSRIVTDACLFKTCVGLLQERCHHAMSFLLLKTSVLEMEER